MQMADRRESENFQGKHSRPSAPIQSPNSRSFDVNVNKNGSSMSSPRHSQNLQQERFPIPAHSADLTNRASHAMPQKANMIDSQQSIPSSASVAPNEQRRDSNDVRSQDLGQESTRSYGARAKGTPSSTSQPHEGATEKHRGAPQNKNEDPASRMQIREMANSLLGKQPQGPTVDSSVFSQQIERRSIFKENPNVYYMNGESLSRPLSIPPDIRKKRWIFVAIAFIIACLMLFFYFDHVINAPARAEEQMQELLAREVSTNPPDMLKMLSRTDKKIKSSLESTAKKGGYEIVDMTDPNSSSTDMNLVKLPPGVSKEEAAVLYAQGLNNLTALQAVTLLDGAWDLDVDRSQGLNISLHYADFKSSSLTTAIAQAIASEGLTRGKTNESGDDDGFGNAYSSGTIMIKNVDYDWTVSATHLKEVYSVYGMPENATYVGIRIIKKPS